MMRAFATAVLCLVVASCASRGDRGPDRDYGPLVEIWRKEVDHMLHKAGMGGYASKLTLGVEINERMPAGVGAVCRRISRYHYKMIGSSPTLHHAPSRRHEAVHVVEQLAEALGWKMGPPTPGHAPEHHPQWIEHPTGERVYMRHLESYYW